MSNFLFAADLLDDTCEEDLYGFFIGYKMVASKVVQQVNNTYAFVNFEIRNNAERTRKELNKVTIQIKYTTGYNKISKSVRLCRYESRSSKLMIDIMGKSKGFVFISYNKWEDAVKAKDNLNDKELL